MTVFPQRRSPLLRYRTFLERGGCFSRLGAGELTFQRGDRPHQIVTLPASWARARGGLRLRMEFRFLAIGALKHSNAARLSDAGNRSDEGHRFSAGLALRRRWRSIGRWRWLVDHRPVLHVGAGDDYALPTFHHKTRSVRSRTSDGPDRGSRRSSC
jgi:hypothetical protein